MAALTDTRPLPRIWIDCDDLISHFDGWITPTGICRVQLEIIPHLMELAPGRIVLCRLGRSPREFEIVSPEVLYGLTQRSGLPGATGKSPAARALRFAMLRSARFARRMLRRARPLPQQDLPKRGDWLLAMGGTWSNPGFPKAAAALKRECGVHLAHLVHDLLPATHPDLVADRHVARFSSWLREIDALTDRFLTPSQHVAAELARYLVAGGRAHVPVTPIGFGSGFSVRTPPDSAAQGPAGSFVMFVSTIEVRKNHLFIARVWQRLIERHGEGQVPTLLLVGRFGWKAQPFARFLHDTHALNGKIAVMTSLADAELSSLYENCLFTVFPSRGEGWGLPVAESLSHGKPCVAAFNSSIPEVGGDAADYFDAQDESSAVSAIERMLFEPGYREAREAWIRENYRPRSWEDAARTILHGLGPDPQTDRGHADR